MNLNELYNIGKTFSLIFYDDLIGSRAAQDRNTEQFGPTMPATVETSLFQALSPEKLHPTIQFNETPEYLPQHSIPKTALHEKLSIGETFQRIKIAGDFEDMSHIEDLEDAVGPLLRAMVIREK